MAKLPATLATVLLAASALAPAQVSPSPGADDDVVVTGVRDVVVNGRVRRCEPVRGDPLSRISLPSFITGPRQQSVVDPDGRGGWNVVPDDEPLTGPDVWQRAGRGLDQYVYRVTAPDRPLCIGGSAPDRGTFAQLRRIVDSRPFWGKRARFTVWVVSSRAARVNFWLAAGHRTRTLENGGNTNNRSFGGSRGWTPVMIEVGPIKLHADHLSYGFLLGGPGDVWFYHPELTAVAPDDPSARKGDVSVFGESLR